MVLLGAPAPIHDVATALNVSRRGFHEAGLASEPVPVMNTNSERLPHARHWADEKTGPPPVRTVWRESRVGVS